MVPNSYNNCDHYIHAYIHTYKHNIIYAYIHTYIHTYLNTITFIQDKSHYLIYLIQSVIEHTICL